MEKLVANLRLAMAANLKDLKWMGPETRVQAKAKLDAFDPKIGYPVKFKTYDGLTVTATTPLANQIAAEHGKAMDPRELRLRTLVNDEVRQDGNTRDLVRDVPSLVAWCSEIMTLLPGDIILTGTPAGSTVVGPGDLVEVELTEGPGQAKTGAKKDGPLGTKGDEPEGGFEPQPR